MFISICLYNFVICLFFDLYSACCQLLPAEDIGLESFQRSQSKVKWKVGDAKCRCYQHIQFLLLPIGILNIYTF